MSSALREWRGTSGEVLDEIELVHRRVEGTGVGGRILTRQVNYAYATLIAAHFQGYCRAVHTEAARALAVTVLDSALASVFAGLLTEKRAVDRGNPTPRNLGRDFDRFGFGFWSHIEAADRRNRKRKEKLSQLCEWRNGITHADVSRKRAAGQLVPSEIDLSACRDWRRSIGALATSIDMVVFAQSQKLGCAKPW
jgi:hypothetical protein